MLGEKEKILRFLLGVLNTNFTSASDDANDTMIRGGIITFYVFLFCAAFIFAGVMCIAQGVESCARDARNKRNERKKENNTVQLETLGIAEKQNGDEKLKTEEVVIEIEFPDETISDESEDESRSEVKEAGDEIFNKGYGR